LQKTKKKQKSNEKKLKTKNGVAQKKQSGREVPGVSPEVGRESMVGKSYLLTGLVNVNGLSRKR